MSFKTGGSLCDLLCKGLPLVKTDWAKWVFIFCDERVVPFDNMDSTFKIYKEKLIPLIPIREEQFVVINPTLSGFILIYNKVFTFWLNDFLF